MAAAWDYAAHARFISMVWPSAPARSQSAQSARKKSRPSRGWRAMVSCIPCSAPGFRSRSRNVGTANPARSCRRPPCCDKRPGPRSMRSIARWRATSAAARPINVFAGLCDGPRTSRREEWTMGAERKISRRAFLAAGGRAGAGLVLGFNILDTRAASEAQTASVNAEIRPNAWLRIAPDGQITVLVEIPEMGQGPRTIDAKMLAEELE